MNLDLDLREISRGSSILSRPILTIWGDLRSTIPGALARSKFQVADRVGYKQESWKTSLPHFIEGLYMKRFNKETPDVVLPFKQINKLKVQKKEAAKQQKVLKRASSVLFNGEKQVREGKGL